MARLALQSLLSRQEPSIAETSANLPLESLINPATSKLWVGGSNPPGRAKASETGVQCWASMLASTLGPIARAPGVASLMETTTERPAANRTLDCGHGFAFPMLGRVGTLQ